MGKLVTDLTSPAPKPDHPDLFGHPAGMTFLFTTEMWERFSYYGMRALLVLYMVKYLLLPGKAAEVWGYAGFKTGLESLFGPLEPQQMASQIYGLYTGLVYMTPILGGLLADRVLGRSRTVIIGALLMAMGHFMMASEHLFLPALLLLILGNGAFKPNITSQISMRRAIIAATAPIRSSMWASISAPSSHPWSAAHSAKRWDGTMALLPPAWGCWSVLAFIFTPCGRYPWTPGSGPAPPARTIRRWTARSGNPSAPC
jgi:hypothetical protein